MERNSSAKYSLGIQSFVSPYKDGKAESSVQTMNTFSSFQFSEQNTSLPLNTPSRQFNNTYDYSNEKTKTKRQDGTLYKIPQIQPDINQLQLLQKWILMYDRDCQIAQNRIRLNKQLIKKQKYKNQKIICSIYDHQKETQRDRESCKKVKNITSRRSKSKQSSVRNQITDIRNNIEYLMMQVNKMDVKVQKKKSHTSTANLCYRNSPIYIIAGGTAGNYPMVNHTQMKNNGYFKSNQPIPQYSSRNNINARKNKSSKVMMNPQLYGVQFSKKQSINFEGHPSTKNFSFFNEPRNIQHSRKSSMKQKTLRTDPSNQSLKQSKNSHKLNVKWDNDGEEKDVLELLNKNMKNKPLQIRKITSPRQQEQSKVNIMVEQSISSIDKRSRMMMPPRTRAMKDSIIQIDLPEEDSNSKSQEVQIQALITRKKSFSIQQKLIQVNANKNTKHSQQITKTRINQYPEENIVKDTPAKKNKLKKSRIVDIKDIAIDEENLGSSEIFQSPLNVNLINHSYQQQDHDDITSIKLLTISKISKDREISERGQFQKEEDQMENYRSQSVKLTNNNKKQKSIINQPQRQRMDSIQEEEIDEEILQKQERDRRRKISGTRFSVQYNNQ